LPDDFGPALDAATERPLDEARISAVRAMLRHGRYRPSGRGKPASEYLARLPSDRFPRIYPVVDVINLTSLEAQLPVSLIDLGRLGASAFHLRRGREGEGYVFNAGGQTIDVQDLLTVCTVPDDEPVANPVKDSMRAKVGPDSGDVLAVVYCPVDWATAGRDAVDRIAERWRAWGAAVVSDHCGAGSVDLVWPPV
jgi:DNA/RNA-binding domain of Phe-tRNA-synthetase-like protein